jgi:small nuclear ribonucleoprotein (snRNP)-like protein
MLKVYGACVYVYLSILKAFDQHLNMVLGEVVESITTREIDEETEEELIKVPPSSSDQIANLTNTSTSRFREGISTCFLLEAIWLFWYRPHSELVRRSVDCNRFIE